MIFNEALLVVAGFDNTKVLQGPICVYEFFVTIKLEINFNMFCDDLTSRAYITPILYSIEHNLAFQFEKIF